MRCRGTLGLVFIPGWAGDRVRRQESLSRTEAAIASVRLVRSKGSGLDQHCSFPQDGFQCVPSPYCTGSSFQTVDTH